MDAAGVVADHAAERVVVVSRRIRSKRQMAPLRCAAKVVEHDTRLDPGQSFPVVDGLDVIQIFRIIDNHRSIAALSGEAGAAAARQHRRAVLAAQLDRGDHICDISGYDDADRYLAVI